MPGSLNFKGTPGLAAVRARTIEQQEAALQAAAERLNEAEREELRAQIVTPPVRRKREGSPVGPSSEVSVSERATERFVPPSDGVIVPITEATTEEES